MSIYSGFPTRKDETNYNQLLAKLLQVMQAHLLELASPETFSHSKQSTYTRIISKMQQYEEHKYLPPKFSQLLKPLWSSLGLSQKVQNVSRLHTESAYESIGGQQKIKTSSPSLNKFGKNKQKQWIIGKKDGFESTEKSKYFQSKANKKERQFRGSETSTRKKDKFHQSFYEIHQKKLMKMNHRYNKKVQLLQQQQEQANQGLSRVNYRSHTHNPSDNFPIMKNANQIIAQKYVLNNFKILQQAQRQIDLPYPTLGLQSIKKPNVDSLDL